LGVFELDESTFGAKRMRGKRSRGAAGKTPVFGLLKREGKAVVSMGQNFSRKGFMPSIQGKILEGMTVHTDGGSACDGLTVHEGDPYRVFPCKNAFARGKSHVHGTEAFWSFAKRRCAQCNDSRGDVFLLYWKECECRYNNRGANLLSLWPNQ
jgi:transposase